MTQITAFHGHKCAAQGTKAQVALALHAAGVDANANGYLMFEDGTGRAVDLDLSGDAQAIAARYAPPPPVAGAQAADAAKGGAAPQPRGRGRPKLGVTAREITLLPRHWEWLASQRGGASATLRRLVDEARKAETINPATARDAAYRFASAIAGDLPQFEDAMRSLYAGDSAACAAHIAPWPDDIRRYFWALAHPA